MRIGEIAAVSGCHLETIRYYERVGLLPKPPRTMGGYRVYGPQDLDRIRFVTRGRDLGFSLEAIRGLLQLSENADLSCLEVDQLARQHLTDIEAKLGDLRRMALELRRVIHTCNGGERGQCTILATLREPAIRPSSRLSQDA